MVRGSKRRQEAIDELEKNTLIDNDERVHILPRFYQHLITTWYGESKPRFAEFNEDGTVNQENRSLNRRVEFVILNPGQS